jgi:hypothetical protein
MLHHAFVKPLSFRIRESKWRKVRPLPLHLPHHFHLHIFYHSPCASLDFALVDGAALPQFRWVWFLHSTSPRDQIQSSVLPLYNSLKPKHHPPRTGNTSCSRPHHHLPPLSVVNTLTWTSKMSMSSLATLNVETRGVAILGSY